LEINYVRGTAPKLTLKTNDEKNIEENAIEKWTSDNIYNYLISKLE
jgi:hypothetical protein